MTYGNGPQGQQQWGPQGPQGYPQQQPKKKSKLKLALIILGVLLLIGFCASVVGGGEESNTAGSPATSSEVAQPAEEGQPAEEAQPAEEEEPDVPREYKNALKSAQSYVDIMSFSYQGLYDQLTSEYADKYSPEAAQYAVDNVDADWDAEAVEAAESYLDTMPFSREELVDQLSSEYADKFTVEQAQAAVDAVY